ncbi:hypothetical protein IS189_0096 [Staphylococcus aureus subsp. aureus IS-189]|nr:hypothetical protein IS189_0096 [Staphylococcus aureus subsp. aureus IS-189]
MHKILNLRKTLKKIAETLNLLYQLTGNQNGVKVVKEVVDRTDLSSDKSVDSETM